MDITDGLSSLPLVDGQPGNTVSWVTMRNSIVAVMIVAVSACQIVYDADDFRNPQDSQDASLADARQSVDSGPAIDAPTPDPDAAFDAAVIDSGPAVDAPDPTSCESLCTNGTCIPGSPSDVCHIDCSLAGVNCDGRVECPAGLSCLVSCGDGDCLDGVDCSNGGVCNILCLGTDTCGGEVTCGPMGCQVSCSGANTCNGLIACSTGFCDINCFGTNSCNGTINCKDSCECDTQCSADTCLGTVNCPTGCDVGNTCSAMVDPMCSSC